MKKLLFLDRDGTIIVEPPEDYQVDHIDKLEFLPGAICNIAAIARDLDYELIMITNQDGLGTQSFPQEQFELPHRVMLQVLESVGVTWREIIIDESFPRDNSLLRKPNIGRVKHYLNSDFDLANSFVIGDRITDMIFAKNIGARGIMLGKSLDETEDHRAAEMDLSETIYLETNQWSEIYQALKGLPRLVTHQRKTKETDVSISLLLEGSGQSDIHTGLAFFDHMLDQIGRHGGLDLNIQTVGDLHIDEHHTIEDTALALGEAFEKALGSKRGVERYGFALPMDDCQAMVSLDFGGRPWLVWEVDFEREKLGDVPTEMFFHFFKSFSDTAKCNLHIRADGKNEHHKIEAVFKAFARSIKRAVKRDMEHFDLPSTKGIL